MQARTRGDGVVIGRRIHVQQTSIVVDFDVDDPIRVGVDNGARALGDWRVAQRIKHGSIGQHRMTLVASFAILRAPTQTPGIQPSLSFRMAASVIRHTVTPAPPSFRGLWAFLRCWQAAWAERVLLNCP